MNRFPTPITCGEHVGYGRESNLPGALDQLGRLAVGQSVSLSPHVQTGFLYAVRTPARA